MFEGMGGTELIDQITAHDHASAATDARKYAAIATFMTLRKAQNGPTMSRWAADAYDGAIAELAAALNTGWGRAKSAADLALWLRDTFPKLNALFHQGKLTQRQAWRVQRRTRLVVDPDVHAQLDERIAERIIDWGPLPEELLDAQIDTEVEKLDPNAVVRAKVNEKLLDFVIGDDYTDRDHPKAGTTAHFGRMSTADAAIARRRLASMLAQLCDDDPRTPQARRAAVFAAVFAGDDRVACHCGTSECPTKDVPDATASRTLIHVLTDPASIDAAHQMNTEAQAETVEPDDTQPESTPSKQSAEARPASPHPVEAEPAEAHTEPVPAETTTAPIEPLPVEAEPAQGEPEPAKPAQTPAPRRLQPVGYLPDTRAIIPGALLADLIARGATIQPLIAPCTQAKGYHPTPTQRRYVTLRDLTCRSPGCTRRIADLDHTIRYPDGPTHPGNLAGYCRKCHLIKTFHAGWKHVQHPDGRITVTTPTGHTYTTRPGSQLLFPTTVFHDLAPPGRQDPDTPSPYRDIKMPRRTRTREQDTAARIHAERQANAQARAEEAAALSNPPPNRTPQRPSPVDDDPPPVIDDTPPPF